MGFFNKKELEEIERLKKQMSKMDSTISIYEKKLDDYRTEINNYQDKFNKIEDLDNKIAEKDSKLNQIKNEIEENENYLNELEKQHDRLIKQKEDSMKLIDMNAYEFNYHYENSKEYEEQLKQLKEKQKFMMSYDADAIIQLVPSEYYHLGGAIEHFEVEWMWKCNLKKRNKQRNNIDKLLIRAFNNECDSIIANVRYSNIGTSSDKIKKSFVAMNKFTKMLGSKITEEYLNSKLEELELRCSYIIKKEEEKEEQRRIREQMKEEERVRKELEIEEKKVEKEEQHFITELNKLQKRMAKENEENQAKLLKQIEELQFRLSEISEVKADIMNRRMNNKAGYVYIISNIGSFGENVFKIGTTRRLDPQIRVDELSSASVPFKYDVHAMIFTDDAFKLENDLHKAFDNKRINKVNKHKEFFNVTLDEIEEEVHKYNATVEFTKIAKADEYRLSLNL